MVRMAPHLVVTASLLSLSVHLLWAQSAPPKNLQVSAFEQYVVYWTTEPGWRTELQLRNNLESADLVVDPAVRTPEGVEAALPAVTIKSGDVVSLDIYDALMKAAPQLAGSWGSVVLRYRAVVYHALYAAAMVRAEGHPIAFHLDASMDVPSYTTGSREGIWWLPQGTATSYLIVTNMGDQKLEPTLVLYDAGGKTWQQKLSLNARETSRLSLRALLQQSGLTGTARRHQDRHGKRSGISRFRARSVR